MEGAGISVCQENIQTPLRLCGKCDDFTPALWLICTGLSPDWDQQENGRVKNVRGQFRQTEWITDEG